jgi:hypothetical protein
MAVQSDFRIIAVNEYIGTDPSALNTYRSARKKSEPAVQSVQGLISSD